MGLAKNALFLALLIAACNLSVVAAHHLDPEDAPTEDVLPWTRPAKRAALHRRLWSSRGSPTRSA